jgi:hypothetical protein
MISKNHPNLKRKKPSKVQINITTNTPTILIVLTMSNKIHPFLILTGKYTQII